MDSVVRESLLDDVAFVIALYICSIAGGLLMDKLHSYDPVRVL
jgi:hypothetical protein